MVPDGMVAILYTLSIFACINQNGNLDEAAAPYNGNFL